MARAVDTFAALANAHRVRILLVLAAAGADGATPYELCHASGSSSTETCRRDTLQLDAVGLAVQGPASDRYRWRITDAGRQWVRLIAGRTPGATGGDS